MMKATAPITGGMICPPMRGGRLDAAGEGGAVAEALHQGDRELADGDDVGDARARDRAHQRRTRTPRPWPARRGVRRPGPSATSLKSWIIPARLEEGAEQDEEEDVGRRDVGRDAVDALGAEGDMLLDDLGEVVAAMDRAAPADAGRRGSRRGRPATDQRQGRAHQPPRRRRRRGSTSTECRRRGRTRVRIAGSRDQIGVEDPVVEPDREADDAEHPAERHARRGSCARDGWRSARTPSSSRKPTWTARTHLARQRSRTGRDQSWKSREGDGDARAPRGPQPSPQPVGRPCSIVDFQLGAQAGTSS